MVNAVCDIHTLIQNMTQYVYMTLEKLIYCDSLAKAGLLKYM